MSLNITKEASGFVRGLDAKQFKQVMNKVLSLLSNPTPADSNALRGYENLLRVDIGEYRIVYRFDDKQVSVLVIDKRNDDQAYKKLTRKNI
ncbi:MAG: addiction module toxin RelE [Cyanobacteria bacterium DS2.3.42]|nr:addiction module toxin RelE [Cyanobacteria bacterium DS2.3.42]